VVLLETPEVDLSNYPAVRHHRTMLLNSHCVEHNPHLSGFQAIEFRRHTVNLGERVHFAQYFVRTYLLGSLIAAAYSVPVLAQTDSGVAKAGLPRAADERDGQHDFDFEIGTWKIHLSRLQDRLAGSKTWVKFDGKSVTRKVWDGRANLEEFETDSPTGHIEGLTLRVYNPQTHQWSIYWANSKDPALGQPIQPMIGEFKNGRGEFYDQELWKGRSVFVRFAWSDITPNSAHFEQSYSDDGGKTWEVN